MTAPDPSAVRVRALQRLDYLPCVAQMRAFTASRGPDTVDEIWLVEHPPVFTQGLAGKPEHLLDPGDIPVVRTERGGQVTFHGPGQLLVYLLLDLHRRRLTVRDLVCRIEQAVIDTLRELGLATGRRAKAPGVYLEPAAHGAKIAALGLKVTRGCTFHGLALNVDMDLSPFGRINPCGYPGLQVTDLHGCAILQPMEAVAGRLVQHLLDRLADPPVVKPAPLSSPPSCARPMERP